MRRPIPHHSRPHWGVYPRQAFSFCGRVRLVEGCRDRHFESTNFCFLRFSPGRALGPGDSAAGRCPLGHSPLRFAYRAGGPGEKAAKGGPGFLRGQPGAGSKAQRWGRQLHRGGVSKPAAGVGGGGDAQLGLAPPYSPREGDGASGGGATSGSPPPALT